MSASTIKEKGKKTPKKGPNDYSCDPSELGESIDTLSEVELKMRLEAMDTFGKWFGSYIKKLWQLFQDHGCDIKIIHCCSGTLLRCWRLTRIVERSWCTLTAGALATMSTSP